MMCLSTVYYGKKKKAELAKFPDMVKCWKVVKRGGSRYRPPIYDAYDYEKGWNEVKPISNCSGYWVAYHAFLSKKDANRWKYGDNRVIQCKTAKTDIVAIGKQSNGTNSNNLSVIVTKRIWIPKPKKQA